VIGTKGEGLKIRSEVNTLWKSFKEKQALSKEMAK
jgi:hypothetical protein